MKKRHILLFMPTLICSCMSSSFKGDFNDWDDSASDIQTSPACEVMGTWYAECSEAEQPLQDILTSCMTELDYITETCDIDAASAYAAGLEATYTCYLELEFCATPEDIEAYPNAIETCSQLFDEQIADYDSCFNNNPDLVTITSVEPDVIEYTEPFSLRNELSLSDDDYAHLELPFDVLFFDSVISTLTITSNGVVLAGEQNSDACCFGLPIPTVDQHNGLIALGWTDLIPSPQNNVSWDIIGEEPQRELWINYNHIPSYNGNNNHVASRLKYVEGEAYYDIYIDSIIVDEYATIGLESPDGNLAIVNASHNQDLIHISEAAFRYRTDVFQ